MNSDSIRIQSSFVQSSSRQIRIESESRSHEQISSCNNGACSTLHVYYFHRQKKTHPSLIFAAVSGSIPVSLPAISGAQTLSGLRGIAEYRIRRIFRYMYKHLEHLRDGPPKIYIYIYIYSEIQSHLNAIKSLLRSQLDVRSGP